MITIQVNESPIQVEADVNVLQVLQQAGYPLTGIAVAINSEVIPQAKWGNRSTQSQ